MTKWTPVSEHPLTSGFKQPDDVLLYSPECGTRVGRVYRYKDGLTTTTMAHVNGDCGATHFMPLPEPPK